MNVDATLSMETELVTTQEGLICVHVILVILAMDLTVLASF